MKDYEVWRKGFDDDAGNRKSAGSTGGHIFRSKNDPNDIFILMEMEDLEKVQKFVRSDQLKMTMEEAGVIGKPDIHFLDEGARFSH